MTPDQTPDPGSFVESGTFRVDRARAIEKLSRYQMPDPRHFVRPWLRVAVLQGASRIAASAEAGRSALSFDGAPLEAKLLEDPFSYLVEESESSSHEAGRMLAVGLLACLRLNPAEVELRSGGRRWRRKSDASETCDEDASAAPSTTLTVRWTEPGEAERFVHEVRAAAGMLPVPLDAGGEVLAPYSAAKGAPVAMSRDRMRTFSFRPDAFNVRGKALLYRNGVLLERRSRPGFELLEAHVNVDGLTLDISASAAAEGDELKTALDSAEAEAERAFPRAERPGAGSRAAQALMEIACMGFLALMGSAFAVMGYDHSRNTADALVGTAIPLACFSGVIAMLVSMVRRGRS